MDMRWSALDQPPEELLAEVTERYGTSYSITARRLTGGYANDVFRLDGAGPPTVLHVKHPPADGDVARAPGGPAGPVDRNAVAKMLGRLHSWSGKVSSRPNHARLLHLPLPPVRQLPAALAPWQNAIVTARAELTTFVKWLERERRPVTGITHNDISPATCWSTKDG
jgi:hypothetical protein